MGKPGASSITDMIIKAIRIQLIVHVLFRLCHSVQLRNGIIGEPYIQCEDRAITLEFHTKESFTGKVFVKGKYSDPDCVINFGQNVRTQMAYTLELGKCGMQRLRSVAPRGMNFGVTMIISFHPIFITSIDRAYNVQCLYKEPDERVRVDLTVSELPTQQPLEYFSANPKCEYTVRRDSPNGPLVSFANVGDTVYHVWSCAGTPDLGVLVKQCFVGDANNQVAVIDDNGCVTDDLLLDELTYDVSLTRAHSSSRVFKYADSNQLFFTCQIGMCHKAQGDCHLVTPPICNRRNISSVISRGRRSIDHVKLYELDVVTPEMVVMDIDNKINDEQKLMLRSEGPIELLSDTLPNAQPIQCFTPLTMSLIISSIIMVCILSSLLTVYITRRSLLNRHASLFNKLSGLHVVESAKSSRPSTSRSIISSSTNTSTCSGSTLGH